MSGTAHSATLTLFLWPSQKPLSLTESTLKPLTIKGTTALTSLCRQIIRLLLACHACSALFWGGLCPAASGLLQSQLHAAGSLLQRGCCTAHCTRHLTSMHPRLDQRMRQVPANPDPCDKKILTTHALARVVFHTKKGAEFIATSRVRPSVPQQMLPPPIV